MAQYCNFCGTENLEWSELAPKQWRLIDSKGEAHHCSIEEQKEYRQKLKEENEKLIRKHKEANGYL